MHSRLKRREILSIVLLAALIRAAFARAWGQTVYAQIPFLDARAHDDWARAIADGHYFREAAFYQSPLYPYLLAPLWAWLGPVPGVVTWAQVFLSALTCGLIARATARRFGRAAGLAAGVLAASDRAMVFYVGPLMKETLALFLLALVLNAVAGRARGRRAFAAGAWLGLSALVRTNVLVLAPVIAWGWPKRGTLIPLGAFALGGAVAILPATWHNWVVGRELVLVNSGGGFNFYIGNSSSGAALTYPPGVSTDPAREEADVTRVARAEAGRSLSPSEVSAHWFAKGLRFLRAQSPFNLGVLMINKISLFFSDREIGDNYDLDFIGAHVVSGLRFAFVTFAVVTALAGVGLGGRRARAFLALALVYAASVLIFYVNDRYRLPVLIFLLPLAGRGLARVIAWTRAGRWRRLAWGSVRAAPALALGFAPLGARTAGVNAFNWGLLASLYADAGRDAASVAAMDRALAAGPELVDAAAYVKASTAHERLGHIPEARELLRRATVIHPDDGLTYFNLGRFAYEHGDPAAAERHYLRAAAVSPWLHQPRVGLAILYLTRGDRARARREVAAGRALSPDDPQLRALAELAR